MTGLGELDAVADDVRVMPAAPETVRVSLLGGRTQVDVALPADVPVATFLPELAQMIASRDKRDDDVVDRDERRTFWTLHRVDGDTAIGPEQTLRGAAVQDGDLLRISTQRALTPPTLYDDVVDAAARLNRAAYAAWDATSAGVMAFAGLWICTAVWVYFLVTTIISAHRGVVVGGAVLTAVTILIGAVLVHRAVGRDDIANAAGPPLLALSTALMWDMTARFGPCGFAAGCCALVVLAAIYYRVIGTGHWTYLAASVMFVFGAAVSVGSALGVRPAALAAVAATVATLGCLWVPAFTARLEPLMWPSAVADVGSAAVPRAEDVWAHVRSTLLTRTGLLVGFGAVAVAAAAVLQHLDSGWSTLVFALVCAAVLALRSRRLRTVSERAALGVAATVLFLIACVQAHSGPGPLPLVGACLLAVVVITGMMAGLAGADSGLPAWVSTATSRLEYAVLASLIPVALWPLGIYDRLGW